MKIKFLSEYADVPAVEGFFGFASTDRLTYAPLDICLLELRTLNADAHSYRVEWHDGLGRSYGSHSARLEAGRARIAFPVGGSLGMQYILIWFVSGEVSEERVHDRLVNIYLEASTSIECGEGSISSLFPLSKQSMRLNRRRYRLPEGETVGYTTADSGNNLDFWLRDMFYSFPGYSLWETDIKSGYNAFWNRQQPDGHYPDWVEEDGKSQRMSSESDVEYIAALALEKVWLVSGDDNWLRSNIEGVAKGLKYLTSDPVRWEKAVGFVRRGHTCDTWDFDIESNEYQPEISAVAAICDQAGLCAALGAMERMYRYLGDEDSATTYHKEQTELRDRCHKGFWDGEKFQHHLHLTEIDHGSFDESRQLAMGNVWAMTRGLASREQCRAIIETYEKRWLETGHRFPWWSLEPGYPVEQGKVLALNSDYLRPGGYCNGGMMPFVGASLALAAFQNGREELGFRLLADYADFLKESNGGIFTWYWPNMEPGFRTTTSNTTSHDGWSMGHWVDTLVQGLAGIKVLGPGLKKVEISPRLSSGDIAKARITVHFPSIDQYCSYQYKADDSSIRCVVTGSSDHVLLRILMPKEKRCLVVTVNQESVSFRKTCVEDSIYVEVDLAGHALWDVRLSLEAAA